MKKWLGWIIVIGILGAGGAYGYSWFKSSTKEPLPNFKTESVQRGNIVATISATGTIEPEDLIDVGAQVAGRIVAFGKDRRGKIVDYGSEVRQGTILAKIDDTAYLTDLEIAEAALHKTQADQEYAKINLKQLQAKLEQARRDWERAQKLGPSDALARSAYDNYHSVFEVAEANVQVGNAAIQQTQTAIEQAQANINRVRQNLSYCTIKSPVNGVIIDRRVNIGQTVVASLNAPSLFLIAKDLRQVQIWVAVNEADIGAIHTDQPVTFTVDAFPKETFEGKVGKIRLNASMTQNVVSYTVEVDIDNSKGRLLPYLTASVKFQTTQHDNVLIIPKTALRWNPPQSLLKTANHNSSPENGKVGGNRSNSGAKENKQNSEKERIWVLTNENLRQIPVEVGLTGDTDVEISGPEIEEGLVVVTGIDEDGSKPQAAAAGGNPFVPQIRFGKSGRAR